MSSVITTIAFGLIAAIGTLLRWHLGTAMNRTLPWGTFLVNVVGSFVLGVAVAHDWENITLIGGAALGSFTTFSTFTLEAVTQWGTRKERRTAIGYVGTTIVVGVAAALLGLQL